MDQGGDSPYLGRRSSIDKTYSWETYNEAHKITTEIGAGLAKLGVQNQTLLGIYSDNSPEWIYTLDASCLYGFVVVSLYDSLGANAASFILENSEMRTVLVSEARLLNLVDVLKLNKFQVTTVILMDSEAISNQVKVDLNSICIEIYTFSQVLKFGKDNPINLPEIKPKDLHFICYSSGTTGSPKGIMISHGTNVSNVLGAADFILFDSSARYLSYLPLAHVFERASHAVVKYRGARYGFTLDGIRTLVQDMGILKPTIFCF